MGANFDSVERRSSVLLGESMYVWRRRRDLTLPMGGVSFQASRLSNSFLPELPPSSIICCLEGVLVDFCSALDGDEDSIARIGTGGEVSMAEAAGEERTPENGVLRLFGVDVWDEV
jgi:hypothetical protein